MTKALLNMGCVEVSLGDTIGHGTPDSVAAMLDAVLEIAGPDQLAGHFHDTKGRALDNIDLCLDRGIRVFDASIGGLGGCPYAPGAAGNVATEAVNDRLIALGFETGLDRFVHMDKGEFVGRDALRAPVRRTQKAPGHLCSGQHRSAGVGRGIRDVG